MDVPFELDERGYKILQQMRQKAGFETDAQTISEALRIMRALQQQAEMGYSDVVVQTPDTCEQKLLGISVLSKEVHV